MAKLSPQRRAQRRAKLALMDAFAAKAQQAPAGKCADAGFVRSAWHGMNKGESLVQKRGASLCDLVAHRERKARDVEVYDPGFEPVPYVKVVRPKACATKTGRPAKIVPPRHDLRNVRVGNVVRQDGTPHYDTGIREQFKSLERCQRQYLRPENDSLQGKLSKEA